MNFNTIERSFSQITNMLGGGVIALILALLVLGLIVFFIFKSGKQLKIRIPLLPRGMNIIKIGKDDLKNIPGVGSSYSTDSNTEEIPEEKSVVRGLFSGLDLLTGSVKKRYELPLYLVVSQYQAADDLIADSGRDILERIEMKDANGYASGSCVILSRGGLIYHETPGLITEELIRSRPERPLDGIVFVVPVSDLMISNDQERRARIDWHFKQYWSIQNEVEFTFPVYLLISGIEVLDGYEDFWGRESARSRLDDIFGWSNPYNVDFPFDPSMIDEAFYRINEELDEEMKEVVSTSEDCPPDILLFPSSIRSLLKAVKELANGIFTSSSLIHQPKFRGVYFTGTIATSGKKKHKFIERLFMDKVFPERSLATPIIDQLLSADSRLKRLQVFAGSILAGILLWMAVDVAEVVNQSSAMKQVVDRIHDIWREEDGYDAIAPSFQLLAEVDASKFYCCGPIPWSWMISPNLAIETFFQEELFTKKIFPVMECKSRQRIFSLVRPDVVTTDGKLSSRDFNEWINEVTHESQSYSRVRYLMGEVSYRSEASIAEEFAEVTFNLFGQSLPDGFIYDAELWLRAIADNDYDPIILQSHQCPQSTRSAEEIWSATLSAANAEIENEVKRVSAPLAFIRQILAFESGSLNRGPIDREEFSKYVAWNDHVRKVFEKGAGKGFCEVTKNNLTELSQSLTSFDTYPKDFQSQIAGFKSSCQNRLASQMMFDNEQSPRPLYSSIMLNGSFVPQISNNAGRVFQLIGELSDFTFSYVSEETWSNKDGQFFWSVDLLAQALSYADEYFRYAEGNFESVYLPESPKGDRQNYLAQAVALAQLQRAMLSTIESAKFQSLPGARIDFSTLDMKEARIADRVANFKKALNPLLALSSTFEQLGLKPAKRKLLIQAQGQATNLLSEIDELFESNRVYLPKPNPSWTAKNYTEAFYGLLTNSNAKDYLSAQSQRSRILARDYAQPLVVFLSNTEGEFKEPELLAVWRHTLIELNKRENQDPSNDIDVFEQFFLGDFFATNYGNCHEMVKGYTQPTGNSLFAIRWRQLALIATDQCMRLRADNIEREYALVSEAFEKYLAPFYPFNSIKGAKPLSPNNLRKFREIYSGESDGLAERIRVLAWKNQRFSPAENFLRDLDSSLAVLSEIVENSSSRAPGLSIEAILNPDVVFRTDFDVSNHISSKRLYAGKSEIEFPGESSSLHWKFSEKTGFDLHWASGSPYELFSVDGRAVDGKLSFASRGYWSLLRFVEDFRSKKVDVTSLYEESMLLEFKGGIQKSSSSSDITPIEIFVRLTIFGIDPDTQEPKPLRFPENFPNSAPLSS